jgi:PAS domain S-box-containing protein
MQTSVPRGGIERKILTSILVVAIVPLVVALALGLYVSREVLGSTVKQNLLNSAQITAAGLRFNAAAYLSNVTRLAANPSVSDALKHDRGGEPLIRHNTQALSSLVEHLAREASGTAEGDQLPVVVYDRDGTVLACSSGLPEEIGAATAWVADIRGPTFVDLVSVEDEGKYLAQCVAPVVDEDSETYLGYVGQVFDISTHLKFAMGFDPTRGSVLSENTVYQVIYGGGDRRMEVARIDESSTHGGAKLAFDEPDAELAALLLDPAASAKALRLRRYRSFGHTVDAFLAYARIFDERDIFILVYSPASVVYAPIYLWGGLGFGICALGIGFLCLNAYRNVHNNIVRPVLLLNEGAQIIGQGDFELKLKIGTGDEIEELASSFNKMALALKHNIRQLEESEEKYRSLVTSMRDGIFQTNRDMRISFINPAGAEVLGYAHAEQAQNQDFRGMFLEEDDLARFTSQLGETGFVKRPRVWMRRQDGRAICVELSGNFVHDDAGTSVGVEGILRDVTESVRLERAARERAERLSAINQIANVINSSLEAGRLYDSLVVELKKLVNFDYAELALLNDLGDAFETRPLWPEQGRRARRTWNVDGNDNPSAWVARKHECLLVDSLGGAGAAFAGQFPEETQSCLCVPLYATGRIIGTLNLGANKTGVFTQHSVELLEQMAPHMAVAIRNAQLLENLQISLEEVTRAREKLHEANEELKTLDEMKTNLLSNVSHELRTPLVAVMGYTDMIINDKVGPTNDMQKEYLSISLRNIEKLVTLIENLLDFSRLHQGTETLVFDTFDLVDCARSSIQIVLPVADSRQIPVTLNAPSEPILVDGDKGKLGQVFNNLLSNAVKFNDEGGSVTVDLRPTEDSVEVTVSDTGIGIPAEALDKVFTRFYQYDSSSTRKYGGTGIGLAIAQDIARLHGSRITVSSEADGGSTFAFSLPLRHPKHDGGDSPERRPPLAAETHLLIELITEDRSLATQVRGILATESMDVIHAADPERAVALVQKHRPDCVLLDMDGSGEVTPVLEGLLAHGTAGTLPIILLTNDEATFERYRGVVAGRVKRSFRKSTLLSGIRYALSHGTELGAPLGSRVLCVDDDPEILLFIRRCLETEGYEVDCCERGEEALERTATRDYGLVLLDIAMPGMDGWEACRRIKSDAALAKIKVFMVTAKPVDASTPRVQQARADGYLLKPFRSDDLIELVRGIEFGPGGEEA